MKALVGTFNQEKALVRAFSVIVKTGCGTDGSLYTALLKVNTTAANLLSNIPSFKQSATDVLRALHDGIFFDDDNNIHYTNFVRCGELRRCGTK